MEVNSDEIKSVNIKTSDLNRNKNGLYFTSNSYDINNCNIYIVTVPTPVDNNNSPILDPIVNATKLVSKNLSHGDIAVSYTHLTLPTKRIV